MPGRLSRLLALTLLLAGCALLRPEGAAPLPGGGYWTPLTPAELGRSFNAVQRVTGHFGGRQVVFVFYLEVAGDRLALVATTPDGMKLFGLEQTGATIVIDKAPLLPPQMRPAAVLADMQMAFWPAPAVARNLAAAGLALDAGDNRRTIRRGDNTVAVIAYADSDPWRGRVEFEQRAWNYRYSVDTLELDE